MDLVQDILIKHNYVVSFDKLGPNKFSIKTPKRIFEPKQDAREMIVTLQNSIISVYEDGAILDSVDVGEMGIRVGIYYLLTGICRAIRYSPLHIISNNSITNVQNIIEILPSVGLEYLTKENALTNLVAAYIENNTSLETIRLESREQNLELELMNIISLEQFFTKGKADHE
jgi:hypothetical protein